MRHLFLGLVVVMSEDRRDVGHDIFSARCWFLLEKLQHTLRKVVIVHIMGWDSLVFSRYLDQHLMDVILLGHGWLTIHMLFAPLHNLRKDIDASATYGGC